MNAIEREMLVAERQAILAIKWFDGGKISSRQGRRKRVIEKLLDRDEMVQLDAGFKKQERAIHAMEQRNKRIEGEMRQRFRTYRSRKKWVDEMMAAFQSPASVL